VGPACHWQCHAAPSRDWLPWAVLPGYARGGLNAVPTATCPPLDSPSRPSPHASPLAPPSRQRSPLASPLVPPSLPSCRPDRNGLRPPTPRSVVVPPRRSPVGEPPISSAISRAPVGCRRWVAVQRRHYALHRREHGPCARVAARRAHAVRLGRARFRPSDTRFRFYIFRIYLIRYKFKNLCRIHLNSENYEINFVGKVLICTRL
jgi:hypothetical protein